MSMQKKSFFSFSHLIIDSYTIGEKKELIVLAVFNNNIHTKIGTELIISCWPALSISGQLSDLIYQDCKMELFKATDILALVEALKSELEPLVSNVNESAKLINNFLNLPTDSEKVGELYRYITSRYFNMDIK
jgi:hypothetical protein